MRTFERKFYAALGRRDREPQPHQLTTGQRRIVVDIGCPSVEKGIVVDDLEVSDFEDHMQRFALAGRIEHFHRFELRRRQRRNFALVGEPRQASDEVGIPSEASRQLPDQIRMTRKAHLAITWFL